MSHLVFQFRETQSMVGIVLEWDAKKVERSLPQIVDAIKVRTRPRSEGLGN